MVAILGIGEAINEIKPIVYLHSNMGNQKWNSLVYPIPVMLLVPIHPMIFYCFNGTAT